MNANLAFTRREALMAKYSYHRLDQNATAIKHALEQVGATVDSRCPGDYLVGFRGVNYLLEVKTATGALNASQRAFQARWRGHYAVVRDVAAALRAIGAVEPTRFTAGDTPWTDQGR